MLDPKLLRTSLQEVADNLGRRGVTLDTAEFAALEEQRKTTQVALEEQQAKRNQLAKTIGQIKSEDGDASAELKEAEAVNAAIKALEQTLEEGTQKLDDLAQELPNLLDPKAPDGKDEVHNILLRRHGAVPQFSFEAQDHVALAERWGLLDTESAAAMSGSRFAVLRGDLARLHRALGQFMLEMQIGHGYVECQVPALVLGESLFGTGQLPKFASDLFQTTDDFYLIPTAEVPLTNQVANTLLEAEALPKKWTALTPCFRSEAGSYGKDTRGLIRQHQFDKVEIVQIVRPEESDAALEEITGHAEAVLQALGLAYRVMDLCAGDIGFSAARTFDIEVWLPGQNRYREISSCSNFRDFQARRMKARFRNGKKNEPVHTLNGSGVAVGRCLVAVCENFQQADGTVAVPECLEPWMDGRMVLGAD